MTLGADIINVPGTTGDIHSDFQAKFDRAIDLLKTDYEFGFLHIKAIDDLGHDKNLEERLSIIERIDKIIGEALKTLGENHQDMIIVVGGDHTTNIHIGDHSFEPVPFMISTLDTHRKLLKNEDISREIFRDNVTVFNEIDCARGVLGRFPGSEVMSLLKNFRERIRQIKS